MSTELKNRLEAHAKVDFTWFKRHVTEKKYTIAQLRCDVPPTEELMGLMDRIGLGQFEQWVERLRDELEAHPFVATPNNGKCSSCGLVRTHCVHR